MSSNETHYLNERENESKERKKVHYSNGRKKERKKERARQRDWITN